MKTSRLCLFHRISLGRACAVFVVFAIASAGLFASESIVRVAMSDGIELETVVVLPDGEGPWPVVMERTPYNCRKAVVKNLDLAKRGYVAVAQNIRGTGKSAGTWTGFGNDGWGGPGFRDGVDTVAWLRAQSWCNGRIGLFGGSASGIAAQLLVAAAPEGLACAYVNAASDNLYETMFPGGCYRTNTVDTWPNAEPLRPEIRRHPMYDDYWRARDARSRSDVADVPVYVTGVWFDLFQRSTVSYFKVQNTNWLPRSDGHCKLFVYPGAHGAPPGQLEYPDRANQSADAAIGSMMEWYDYWLKDADNGILL
ncbi:MAG: CocE/NonD family hydrolase, partial [Candidatus Hydrogenedentes bacterium]|nr:CocE/NonD family hydrolase [Candidatus Hydrogenedentota bacterium]